MQSHWVLRLEAVVWKCSVEKVFLKFSQYSQENTCTRVSFLMGLATLLKKRLWHRCFTVNFAKFVRTPFFAEHLRWLFCTFSRRLFLTFGNLIVVSIKTRMFVKISYKYFKCEYYFEIKSVSFTRFL